MKGMLLNYVLLAITAQYLIRDMYAFLYGGVADRSLFRPFFMVIVFLLVLVATVMGLGYRDFKLAIETGDWESILYYDCR